MPVETELDAIAQEPFTAREAGPRRVAERPRKLALFASFAALLISIGGLGMSWVSYQSSSRAAADHSGVTQGAQSISLESEVKLNLRLADFEQPSSNDQPIRLVFSWTLRNAGNTAATQVETKWIERLTNKRHAQLRPSVEHDRPMDKMEPHQEVTLPLLVAMTPAEFQTFRHGGGQVEISGTVTYKDASDHDHALNWTAYLQGDAVLTVKQH